MGPVASGSSRGCVKEKVVIEIGALQGGPQPGIGIGDGRKALDVRWMLENVLRASAH